MKISSILGALICFVSTPAFAGEPCRSAKDLVKVAQSFYGANPELTNIVTPQFSLSLKGINGAPDPTAILYRYGDVEETLPIVDGRLEGFEVAAGWSKDGEMCRLVDGDFAPVTEGDSVEASMNFSFPYKRTDGRFSIDEIREGAKDGSKVMSGLAPGGLGFIVPGLKTVILNPAEGSETTPKYVFSRKGKPVDVQASVFWNTTFFRLKDIKASKADLLTIEGEYALSASFKIDPKEMAKAEAKRITALDNTGN